MPVEGATRAPTMTTSDSDSLRRGLIPCILFLLLAGALLGGCKELTAGVPRPAGDDTAVAAQVRSLIMQDPQLKDSQIRVFVLEGNVTLSGAVPDAGAKARLLDAVKDLHGVRSVSDNLEVRKDPRIRSETSGESRWASR